jgi:hypothetical protein
MAHAKDLTDYRIGDTAGEDITTPVALDVIDPDATAARKAAEALKTPAIFRSYPDVTNQVEKEFLAAFADARANFLTDVKSAAEQLVRDSQTNALPDIAKLTADFNRKNEILPISPALAELWARGDAGLSEQTLFVARLREAMRRPIRSDDLPDGFILSDTVRLVPMSDPQENLTLDGAERRGKIATETSIATLTRARSLLRKDFSEDEQPVARALAAFLKTDCALDENLTQAARTRQTSQLAVAAHYDAGQIIIQRGQTIDAKAKAALDQLRDKTLPDQLNQQIAAERARTQQEQERAQMAQAQAEQEHEQALNLAQQTRTRNEWLMGALIGTGTISVVAVLAAWRLSRRQHPAMALLPARVEVMAEANDSWQQRAEKTQAALQAAVAPHLVQALKETLVQGLAAQRNELLEAQQKAAAEITELMRRLDKLQAPMHERLRTYEKRIEELEKELSARNTENHELLKLKIEMMRHQLEVERTASDWSRTLT